MRVARPCIAHALEGASVATKAPLRPGVDAMRTYPVRLQAAFQSTASSGSGSGSSSGSSSSGASGSGSRDMSTAVRKKVKVIIHLWCVVCAWVLPGLYIICMLLLQLWLWLPLSLPRQELGGRGGRCSRTRRTLTTPTHHDHAPGEQERRYLDHGASGLQHER